MPPTRIPESHPRSFPGGINVDLVWAHNDDALFASYKNAVDGSRLSVFLDPRHLDKKLSYFMEFNFSSGTPLYRYRPDPLRVTLKGTQLAETIRADQTTQIQVVLSRDPDPKLFTFHRGDDPDLHVRWNRRGEVTGRKLPVK